MIPPPPSIPCRLRASPPLSRRAARRMRGPTMMDGRSRRAEETSHVNLCLGLGQQRDAARQGKDWSFGLWIWKVEDRDGDTRRCEGEENRARRCSAVEARGAERPCRWLPMFFYLYLYLVDEGCLGQSRAKSICSFLQELNVAVKAKLDMAHTDTVKASIGSCLLPQG
ncbi:hypothetical protein ZWY2020_041798 [Hordeum vulgare]|nr:hypothetical protein ZWY2020_041798 [Hordeum vulgare]